MSGRIRSIKPEILDDEKASALSDAAWRLFVSSWLLADDYGRFRASPRYLAAQVWQDTGRTAGAADALAELVKAGRVRVYQVGGDTYAEIPTWDRHQRVDNAGKPRVPAPEPNDYVGIGAVSPRVAESRRESPLGPPQPAGLAARPPTSDQGPPTSDQGDPACAGAEPSGSGHSPSGPIETPTAGPRAQGEPPTQPTLLPAEPSAAERIFAAYLAGWHKQHPTGTRPPRLDDRRRRLIAARLRDFAVDELEGAARGIWLSEWHVHENQTGIDLALRDSAHVERFRDIAMRPELGKDRPQLNGSGRPAVGQQLDGWRP